MTGIENKVLVVEHHVLELELETDDVPRSLVVRVRVDGEERWSSEEPGWRAVGQGVTADTVFLWSARCLVIVPLEQSSKPQALHCDEDIVTAFKVEGGWLLVCETSLRLIVDGVETSRLELPDVVTSALWRDGLLGVRCDDGSDITVAAIAGGLEVAKE
ncbi:MAG: hypothetical protein HC897_15290 [Thermoanaerobaculia bacterium]|nr:hypothetical protein [Thermoanaerobaculia bacterium]